MEIEKYRTIETTLDLANDYTPPIRLNAGDVDGRILKFHITDGGNDVDDLNGLKANLTWNRDPTDPASGGGYTSMTKTSGTDNPTGVHQVSFTTPVPRALLLQAGERTVAGIDIEDADGNVITSRNIPVLIEPARLNPKAGELADPLKDLHDTIDQAQELIDTASIELGTVTTLNPNKKATGTLTGSGWKRKLNLSIPRGSTISSMTATALDTGTPTVTTGTDTNGDITVALGLPRGKQGEKGDKGDPGDAGGIATADKPGIVMPGSDFGIFSDGTLYLKDNGRLYSQYELFDYPFNVACTVVYSGMGVYSHALLTLSPNRYYNSGKTVTGPVTFPVLSSKYQFTSDSAGTRQVFVQSVSKTTGGAITAEWLIARITPVTGTRNITIEFTDGAGNAKAFTLAGSDSASVYSPPFSVHLNGLKSVS